MSTLEQIATGAKAVVAALPKQREETPEQRRARVIEAAKRYAAADASDPFAFSRAMSHANNGIAVVGSDKDYIYDAEIVPETRILPDDGRPKEDREYTVPAYRNVRRP